MRGIERHGSHGKEKGKGEDRKILGKGYRQLRMQEGQRSRIRHTHMR
jgi:hypothetical protein